MNEFVNALAISASGMRAQATRLRHVAENIANADTPGYRRKTVPFEAEQGRGAVAGQVATGPVTLDQKDLARIYDPSHPMADTSGYYDGSNVDTIIEIADSREAQRGYDANLKMFDQARQMTSALLDLLRR